MDKNTIFVEASGNKKLSGNHRVSATYLSLSSCPSTCELKKTGECYSMSGRVGMITRRLDRGISSKDYLRIAQEESRKIRCSFEGGPIPQDGARGGRDLRAHVSGDCRNNTVAKIFGNAAKNWVSRGGNMPWTYSHAWRSIKRSSWGKHVSVLASLDNPKDAKKALRNHYAPARYVPEFKDDRAWEEHGVRWIPCPAQTKETVCVECRLCMNDKKLKKMKAGIAFAAHGGREHKMRRRLLNG